MRRAIVLVMVALILPATIFGLDVTVGPRIAVSGSRISSDDYDDMVDAAPDGKKTLGLGGQIGAFAEIGIMPFVAIQPEIVFNYGRPGFKYDNAGKDASLIAIITTLDIPILVKGKFEAGPVGATVFAGPMAQFKVGTWKAVDDNGTTETESDIPDDDLKAYALAAVVGAGVEIPGVGPGNLMIDARFVLGLTTFDESAGGPEGKTRSIQVGVGYGIDLM